MPTPKPIANNLYGDGFTFSYSKMKTEQQGEKTYKKVSLPGGANLVFLETKTKDSAGVETISYAAENSRELLKYDPASQAYNLVLLDNSEYTYNASGQIVKYLDPQGNTLHFFLNNNGDISAISDGVTQIDFEYKVVNGYLRLTEVTDVNSGRKAAYDYTKAKRTPNENGSSQPNASPSPDLADRITSTDENGRKTTVRYNEKGKLYRVVDEDAQDMGADKANPILQEVTYYPASEQQREERVKIIKDVTGTTLEYVYDDLNEEVRITEKSSDGKKVGRTVQRYDASLNVTETEEQNAGDDTVNVDNTNYFMEDGQNKFGEVRSETDAYGNITTYKNDSRGNVVRTTYPDGSYERNEYDENNNLTLSVDRLGAYTYSFYDGDNNLVKTARPLDGTSRYNNDGNDNEENFAVERYEYYPAPSAAPSAAASPDADAVPAKGLLKKEFGVKGDANNYTEYTYDAKGNTKEKTVVIDGTRHTTSYTYDSQNRVKAETNPDGTVTRNTYDNAGNLVRVVVQGDEGTSVTRTVYDKLGRMVKEVSPQQYDPGKDNLAEGKYNGPCTETVYDNKGFVKSKTDALGHVTSYEYDDRGNVLEETLPNQSKNIYEYDSLNRKTKTWFFDHTNGSTKLLEETGYGQKARNAVTETTVHFSGSEGDSATTTEVADFDGNAIETRNADGSRTFSQYQKGQLMRETDEGGNVTIYTYDALGQQTSKSSQFEGRDVSKEYYGYDKAGNQTSKKVRVNAPGEEEKLSVTNTAYDPWGRQTETETVIGDGKSSFVRMFYDWNGKVLRKYTGLSESMKTEPGNTTGYSVYSYTYDYLGNVKTETDPNGNTETKEYDAAGNLVKLTDRNQVEHVTEYNLLNSPLKKTSRQVGKNTITKKYSYDAMGNLKTAEENNMEESYGYDGKGNRTKETKNGVVVSMSHDYTGRLVRQTIKKTGGQTLQDIEKSYDDSGNLYKIFEGGEIKATYSYERGGNLIRTENGNGTSEAVEYNKAGLPTFLVNKGKDSQVLSQYRYAYNLDGNQRQKLEGNLKTAYQYDLAGRLTEAVMPGATQTYEFDENGNRTKFTENGVVTTYTYTKKDQLKTETKDGQTTTYGYDRNGNMTSKTGGKAATQTFDLLNRMTRYQKGGTDAAYTYNPNDMRASKTVGGVKTEQIWLGDEIALDSTNENVVKYIHGEKLIQSDYGWYLYNANEDVTTLANDKGEITKCYDYDPYGNPIGASDEADINPYRYSGEYTDFETGYVYLRARYYDPSVGVFTSVDPAQDGTNWYAYCAGNPVNMNDPTGMWAGKIHRQATKEAIKALKSHFKSCLNKKERKVAENELIRGSTIPDDSRGSSKNPFWGKDKFHGRGAFWQEAYRLRTVAWDWYAKDAIYAAFEVLGMGLHTIQDSTAHSFLVNGRTVPFKDPSVSKGNNGQPRLSQKDKAKFRKKYKVYKQKNPALAWHFTLADDPQADFQRQANGLYEWVKTSKANNPRITKMKRLTNEYVSTFFTETYSW